jgi:predicted RNA-binding protein with TRAM domain
MALALSAAVILTMGAVNTADAASNAVVPATVPGVPLIGAATAGDGQATVNFTAPGTEGGTAITSYTVTATDSTIPANGGETATGSGSPITVSGLTNGDTYTFTVSATNGAGTGPASAPSNPATPQASITCPCDLFGSQTPATVDSSDGGAVNLGMAFSTDTNGFITGLRFYKASANTGTHVGDLWNDSGTLLAQATFTNETASGWQQVSFSSPVAVTAGTTDVVSYLAPNGHYSLTGGGFSTMVSTPPLYGLATGSAPNGNGVFAYGSSPAFPTSTFNADNYFVDPVFITSSAPDAPTGVTAITAGDGQATVNFAAPDADGGAAITSYTVTAADSTTPANGGETATGSGSPVTVSGLTNGDTYTFTVTATNDKGTGPASAVSTPVVPQSAPVTPPLLPPPPAHGYWLVGADGGIFTFGSAQFHGSAGSLRLQRPVVGIVPTNDRAGYWLDASDGGVFAFGDSGFYGSIPALGLHPAGSRLPNSLNAPIVGMVPSADGGGYFMVASDGGVFAFGDARFAGSCPGLGGCSGAAVAVMPDASGNGYWVVTATGHVYTFGDAPYYGDPGPQGVPVTSAVRTPDGRGYWILFANGAISTFGDALLFGSPIGLMGGKDPATAIFTTFDGGGYWVTGANGAVASYGDAPNDGSMLGTHLNGSIVAATGW